MRVALTVAVLLAVISMALVAVCQHSETRRLQYRVWQLERRRERIERLRHRLSQAIEATRTPRRLLCERDGRPSAGESPAPRGVDAEAAPIGAESRWLFQTVPGSGR